MPHRLGVRRISSENEQADKWSEPFEHVGHTFLAPVCGAISSSFGKTGMKK